MKNSGVNMKGRNDGQPTVRQNVYYPGYNGSFGQCGVRTEAGERMPVAPTSGYTFFGPANTFPSYVQQKLSHFCHGGPMGNRTKGRMQSPNQQDKPNFSFTPNFTSKPDYSSKPNFSSTPDFTSKPDCSSTPSFTSKPDYGSKQKFSSTPNFTSKRDCGSKPNFSSTPTFTSKPDYVSKPNFRSTPTFTSKPDYGSKPNFSSTPNFTSKPDYGSKPNFSSTPNFISKPDYRSKPNFSSILNFTAKSNFREKHANKDDYETLDEITRGPRTIKTSKSSDLSSEDLLSESSVRKSKNNAEEFPFEYDSAKFFIIKSFSEDDVHRCIKYDVWSSTPYGNKKLDAAFHEAEAKASESGKACPVFLFFSVNASGQFVGVAEMVGKLDFDKTMDFWQLDQWSGFFPVQWHIIKDVPNAQLRHIILDNCENRPVTFTRDAHEVGLKQGIEMLKIFKGYSSRSSLLDDFEFFENREKSLLAKKSGKPATAHQAKAQVLEQIEAGKEEATKRNGWGDPVSSLVNASRNLSLNSLKQKGVN